MTTGCNIFHDKTPMPGKERDELDDLTRTRLATTSRAGALASYSPRPEGMNVDNVTRPRRGHDY
jgi:hypothetical protein